MQNEEWRDILEYENYYQVSSFGRIRSVERDVLRKDGIWQHCKSYILIPFQGTTCNYLSIQLCKNNVTKKFLIHRLVAIAFLGLVRGYGLEVNHKDGNRHNNRLDNLELVSHQENIDHSIAHNLKNDYGEKSTNAKLTNKQASEIRDKWMKGMLQVDLAEMYGVAKQTICNIVHNKTYFR